MKRQLADAELENLSRHVARCLGLNFPEKKWLNLEQAFCTAARELGFQDTRECVAQFTSAPPSKEFIESMACYLTIGETYFFREARCFEVLEQKIIPEIIRERTGKEQRLRIWSAGCATGEEPYSIAILLHRMRDVLRGWHISILATDINPHALRKAREGVYTNWSFRNTSPDFKENYFRKTADGRFELNAGIREMVDFSWFNLADDGYPSLVTDTNAMDVIFCRNVLMYITPHLAGKVVERFHHCLQQGGWLFVSPCETSNPFFSSFAPISFPDAILYQKRSGVKSATPGNVAADVLSSSLFNVPALPMGPVHSAGFSLPSSLLPVKAEPSTPSLTEERDEKPAYQEALKLYEQGAYRKAAESVATLLARDRNNTRALVLLCRIYANEGRLTEALNISNQALAGDKLCAGLHYLRAVILQEQGMNDEATASLKKSLYLDNDMVLAHFTLAILEQRKGKIKESRRHFDNALSLLNGYRPEDVIPESDGMFAGRLQEIIRASTAAM